ncbi:hypothetical protein ONS95_010995 [Cadophora gregata]|uniref:uncharacterized protein n=1 Tax=Cadophora gregata TaxID=51156 RepID=UPI0026DD742B|nr:uncharacterized protein ONS95_010995 [Cadophora gregata]KAK0119555.1 hypothetical protein ONS95_010995 [Cadophora gregata]KAK0120593.1 hypothetical protein ONS96_010797 [Cadophora gregata f. sp. sojae]
MSSQSNSSSMEVHNGSAVDSTNSHPTHTGDSQNAPERQLSNPSTASYHRRQRNAHTSDSTSTPEVPSSVEQHNNAQTNLGHHYFPAFERETLRYDAELIVDDDDQSTTPVNETRSYGGYTQHAPVQNPDHQINQTNGAQSPTTERWTTEQSPEERLRLGLSRYPSEEEQCLAYEEAVDDESRRGQ